MSDLPRHLEQANWHLLSLEGELASIVADHNDRNADATDTQNRLHAAYLEMQELQKALHQAARAMPGSERTRRQVDYVAANAWLNAFAQSRRGAKTRVVAVNWVKNGTMQGA